MTFSQQPHDTGEVCYAARRAKARIIGVEKAMWFHLDFAAPDPGEGQVKGLYRIEDMSNGLGPLNEHVYMIFRYTQWLEPLLQPSTPRKNATQRSTQRRDIHACPRCKWPILPLKG